MMGLSDGERISMIRSAVLIQYTRDGQTDGISVAYTALSIASRGNSFAREQSEQKKWVYPFINLRQKL